MTLHRRFVVATQPSKTVVSVPVHLFSIVVLFVSFMQESFDKLDTWVKGTRRYVPGKDVIVSIIGNKIDLASERVISTAQGQKFATDNEMDFYETSALTGENVMHAFEQLIESIMDARAGGRGRSKNNGDSSCCSLM